MIQQGYSLSTYSSHIHPRRVLGRVSTIGVYFGPWILKRKLLKILGRCKPAPCVEKIHVRYPNITIARDERETTAMFVIRLGRIIYGYVCRWREVKIQMLALFTSISSVLNCCSNSLMSTVVPSLCKVSISLIENVNDDILILFLTLFRFKERRPVSRSIKVDVTADLPGILRLLKFFLVLLYFLYRSFAHLQRKWLEFTFRIFLNILPHCCFWPVRLETVIFF